MSAAKITALVAQITDSEINNDMKEDIARAFVKYDSDESGNISSDELMVALNECGLKVVSSHMTGPNGIFKRYDKNADGVLDLQEFSYVVKHEMATKLKAIHASVRSADGNVLEKDQGRTFVKAGEIYKFSAHLNRTFKRAKDKKIEDLKLFIDTSDDKDILEKVQNGVIFCHLINLIAPDTIPTKLINYDQKMGIFKRTENLNLGINSAVGLGVKAIGCTPSTINDRRPNIILGLLWQLVKKQAMMNIDLTNANVDWSKLLKPGETIQDLMNLSPEELLLRWANYHLAENELYDGDGLKNYKGDLNNGSAYIALMKQIQPADMNPQFTMGKFKADDETRRSEVVQMAKTLGLDDYITEDDLKYNDEKVNILFMSQLFNEYPALDEGEVFVDPDGIEEKTYKNWINSTQPVKQMMFFYPPMATGINFLEIMGNLRPGCVDKKKINDDEAIKKRIGGAMKKKENCKYALDVAKSLDEVKVVGISPDMIESSNPMMTKAITWQLMKIHTVDLCKDLLGDCPRNEVDKRIAQWANEKITAAGKTNNFKHFGDTSLVNGLALLDLVEAIKPGTVNQSYLTDNDYENVKYALALCKMIGAQIYALPDHFTNEEFDKKMIMTVFACMMATAAKIDAEGN